MALSFLLLVLYSTGVHALTPVEALESLELEELAASYSERQVNQLLAGQELGLSATDRRAVAALLSLGALTPDDCADPDRVASKLDAYLNIIQTNHPARVGKVGDVSLPLALGRKWEHDLLKDQRLIEALADSLATGVITGYDIRSRAVYDGFPPGQTFIYSHSSARHLRQLFALLAAEKLSAWVYVTPKVSAFLYRDGWGSGSSKVRTLLSGLSLVEGEELAVLFHFDVAEDRARFHELILNHAKRDSKSEEGIIADAWWQPFYYTDAPLDGFDPISLVVIGSGELEATLTVTLDRSLAVRGVFSHLGFETRIHQVWVNPAFYRFLKGDFK